MATKEPAAEEALLSRHDSEPEGYELDEYSDTHSATTLRPRWLRRHGRSGPTFIFNVLRRRRSLLHRTSQCLTYALLLTFSLVLTCFLFFPSYSSPPQHYLALRQRVLSGESANVHNEKVFIVASLYDEGGTLLSGPWAQSVLSLIDIIGPDNVFLSVYENDPDEGALAALESFAGNVTCQSAIVTENLDLEQLPHLLTVDGTRRLKRIAFLAEVRNRALRPLQNVTSPAYATKFDKLLYLNDIAFDPIDAANLLFSTNMDERTGKSDYLAACAVDFINPFKFYDTFATRDLEGYGTGVPFYPWFAGSSKAESRSDVLLQKDAVRVKSCWGGMVAFEGHWFQQTVAASTSESIGLNHLHSTNNSRSDGKGSSHLQGNEPYSLPGNSSLRFRFETDSFWDASECCLIHADLSAMASSTLEDGETGIYLNPFVRVAYSTSVLRWLWITKRFERLYPPVQTAVNWLANMPFFNPRQFQEPGKDVINRVWEWDSASIAAIHSGEAQSAGQQLHGHFAEIRRNALPGGFCGLRKLSYMNEDHVAGDGSPKWITEMTPTVG